MNDVERVKNMVDGESALVNSYSKDGWTPLHLAAFFGHDSLAELLLDKGALIDNPSRSKASYGNSSLQAAVAMGRMETVKLLLERGANVNFVQEPSGLTALHIAASRKDLAVVRLLIQKGAKKDAVSADGKKPVDIARERQNEEVAEYLRAL
jgi:ankyrin repeat protein